eukprot:m51a1_g9009 putative polygalacturonase at1g48100-like (2758) ;mRNA; f:142587-155374
MPSSGPTHSAPRDRERAGVLDDGQEPPGDDFLDRVGRVRREQAQRLRELSTLYHRGREGAEAPDSARSGCGSAPPGDATARSLLESPRARERRCETRERAIGQARRYAEEVMRYHHQRQEEGHPVLSPRSLRRVLALRVGEAMDDELERATGDTGHVCADDDDIDDQLAAAEVGYGAGDHRAGSGGESDEEEVDEHSAEVSRAVRAVAGPAKTFGVGSDGEDDFYDSPRRRSTQDAAVGQTPRSPQSARDSARTAGSAAAAASEATDVAEDEDGLWMYVYDDGKPKPRGPAQPKGRVGLGTGQIVSAATGTTVPKPFALSPGGGGQRLLSRRVKQDLEAEAAERERASRGFKARPVPQFIRQRSAQQAAAVSSRSSPSSPAQSPRRASPGATPTPAAGVGTATGSPGGTKPQRSASTTGWDAYSKAKLGIWRDPVKMQAEKVTPFKAKPLPKMYRESPPPSACAAIPSKPASDAESPSLSTSKSRSHLECTKRDEPTFQPQIHRDVPDFEKLQSNFQEWAEKTKPLFVPTIPREFTLNAAARSNYDKILQDIEKDKETLRETRWPFMMTRGKVESSPVVTSYAQPRSKAKTTFTAELRAATVRKQKNEARKAELRQRHKAVELMEAQDEISYMLSVRAPSSVKAKRLEYQEQVRKGIEDLKVREEQYKGNIKSKEEQLRANRILLVEREGVFQAQTSKQALNSVGGTGLSPQQFHHLTKESVRLTLSFGTAGTSFATLEVPTSAATLTQVTLTYVSGAIGCSYRANCYWGCWESMGKVIGVMIADSDRSFLGPPLDGSLGVTWLVRDPLRPSSWAGFWTSPGEDSNSNVLRIPLKNVTFKGPTVQLWYCEDWMDYTESDNVGTVQFTYSITYVPREPIVIMANSIAVTQGVDLAITGSMIRAQGGSRLTFNIFTQDDISAGRVLFVHDNSLSAPSYALTATDGYSTSPESAGTVSFTLANHPPVVVANTIAATEGVDLVLDNTMIRSTDQEGDAVAYTVTAVSHGHFAMADSRNTPITHFDQSNVDGGLVVFVNDGLKEIPSYTLVASDGKESVTSVGTVRYTTVNMAPRIAINQAAITEGVDLVLTSAMVTATDIDNSPEQLSFSASVQHGFFALVSDPTVHVATFTQADVNGGRVLFVGDGLKVAPSWTLVVSDGQLNSAPSVAAVSYTTRNMPPVIVANRLAATEGVATIVHRDGIQVTDQESSDNQITFTVTSTTHGFFSRTTTVPSVSITSFSQADINNGDIAFVNDGLKETPTYTLSVTDGENTVNAAGIVDYITVNMAPSIAVNQAALTEGVDLLFTNAMISATDIDNSPEQLVFTASGIQHGFFALVSNPAAHITTFTQADINSDRVLFVGDGLKVAPSWTLVVSDGQFSSAPSVAAVSYTTRNMPPVVVTNRLAATEGVDTLVTRESILATDQESSDDQITFTVAAAAHGFFSRISAPSTAVTSFTQADINNGMVVFVNDGLKETPTYALSVTDGENTVTSAGVVDFTTVNMAPKIIVNSFAITEGTTLRITKSMIAATDIDNTAEQLTYSASGIANGFFARCDAISTPVASFTQSDIDNSAICFAHDGSAGAPSFTLVVSDGALSSAPSVPTVHFNHVPLVSLPIALQPSCCYAVQGQLYAFAFANSTFVDIDGDALSYAAMLMDGSALPSWLTFDPLARTFSEDSFAIYFECAGLLHVDPQQFLEPPVVNVALEGATLSIDLHLPQMIPHRTGVSAVFVNPTTQKPTGLTLPMPESPCRFGTVSSHNMWDLLKNANPDVRTDEQNYAVEFSVAVLWNETTVLAGRSVVRPTSETVSFVVRIHRAVSASSFIQTLDPTLVWAYVSKASAFPVRDASGAVQYVLMTVQMATVAAQAGYRIDPMSFVVAGLRGAVLRMTQPALQSSDAEVQRWSFTANITGVCSLTAADGFTLNYTLVTDVPRSATHSSTITTAFGHVESWCSVGNSTMGISAAQTTYASNSASAGVVERFFVGDTVFVREAVAADAAQSAAAVVSVVLTGSAVRAGTEVILFAEGSQDAAMQYALVACPSGVDAAVCYSFVVDGGVLQAQGVLNVNTTMRLSLSGHKRAQQAGVVSKVIRGKYVSVTVGDTVFDITQYGARGDGKTDDSAAIQKALDAAQSSGGGIVAIPAGKTFLFKGISINGDHTELNIEGTLLISNDYKSWPTSVKATISVNAKSNVAITGSGTIDGQGAVWWANLRNSFRPKTLYPHNTDTLIVTGITVKDCPDHCLEMYSSNTEMFEITLRAPPSTGIANPSHNTDGIDIHGDNFWVHDSDISVGDDNVAIHSNKVLVEDCLFGNGHGASIGSLCSEQISDITVRNVTFTGTTCGPRIKTVPGCGGSLSNVHFQDLMLNNVQKTIEVSMFYTQSSAKKTGGNFKISNINFVNIKSTNPKAAGDFLCNAKSPCGISMDSVVQSGKSLAYKCSHALVKAVGNESPRPCTAPGEAESGEASNANFTGNSAVEVSNPEVMRGKYVTVTVGDTEFDVTHYGASGGGITDVSAAIQKAIDAATGAGGGIVVIPAGRTFLFKGISINEDHTELNIEGTLLISNDYKSWPSSVKAAISVNAKSNVVITDRGTIDGQGAVWWANLRNSFRSTMLYPHNTDTVIVTVIIVKDCPHHCLEMYSSNTEIFEHSLHDSDISVGDDNVAIHSSKVLVEDCQFCTGHGASIGSLCSCGGSLSNVHFQDLVLNDVQKTIEVTMFYTQSSAKKTGGVFKISNINFVNIKSTNPMTLATFSATPRAPVVSS